ncbi:hypothetical protein [Nocardia altamirensis]|uniref:hypothetical protein n=1 Tax=Nocardia altamirensis TaxID=472158 RepID=UPI00083FFC63|nr:hypothetical protein [Nocardia altamirensis]
MTAIDAMTLRGIADAHDGIEFRTDYSGGTRHRTCIAVVTADPGAAIVVAFDIASALAARDGDGENPGAIRDYLLEFAPSERRRDIGHTVVYWTDLHLATG